MGILWMIVLFILILYAITWMFTKTKTLSNYNIASEPQLFEPTALSSPDSSNYSYSIWVYISSWDTGNTKNIFKRSYTSGTTTIYFPHVYLDTQDNKLMVKVSDTSASKYTECSVMNVPIQTWTNIIVSMNTKVLDIYVNGKLLKTCITSGVPSFNKDGKVELTPAPSFTGYTARFIYSPNVTGPEDAWNIYKSGPGGNMFMSFLNQYKLKLSFLKGSEETASITI
jgi:hypothetical protein